MRINHFKNLFWFLSDKDLDWQKDRNFIIHQVLSYGTMDQVKELFTLYGRETIKKEFQKPRPGLYYPNVLEFFRYIFKINHLEKDKYLKNI